MKKRRLLSVSLALLAVLLLAVPVLAAAYQASLTITETSSNAYTMLGVQVTANNDWMADNGFMNSTANDTRVQTLGGLNYPWMLSDNKTLTALAVEADSQTNLFFTTGESEASAMDIIVGYGGYITRADVASWKLGNNGSIEISGWFDATKAGNIASKDAAFETTADGSGNVTASILSATNTSVTIIPDGAGDLTNIASVFGAATHWQATSSDGEGTSYVYTTSAVYEEDTYTLEDPVYTGTLYSINSVQVGYSYKRANGLAYFKPVIRLSGSETVGTETTYSADTNWHDKAVETLARPGGGSWTEADIDNLQAGIFIKNGAGFQSQVSYVYVVVNYTYTSAAATVTASGVASGEHDIEVTLDGTDMKVYVDSVEEDTVALGAVTVPDNANPWVIMSNATPYLEYYKHYVGGNLVGWYQPTTMILTTVLPDRAGTAENGVITWGANPAGVTVTLGSLVAEDQPVPGTTTERETRDILPEGGGSDWSEEPAVAGALLTHPLRSFITMVSDNTTLTESQTWLWYGIAFVLFFTGLSIRFIHGHKGLIGIAFGISVGAVVAQSVFPLFALAIAILAIVMGVIAERSPTI